MAIRQVITFRVQPGGGPQFIAGFAPIIEKVRKEPGCQQYELFVAQESPDTLVMLERWESQAALEAALARLYPGPDDPSIAFLQLLEGRPEQERYEL